MTILDERELTEDERGAIADEPRPGVWRQTRREPTFDVASLTIQFDENGDGHALTQEETDILIANEIVIRHDGAGVHELISAVGSPRTVTLRTKSTATEYGTPAIFGDAREQRGGIHSDPLVRLLAYRAWGERDRDWFDPVEFALRELDIDEITTERDERLVATVYNVRKGNAVASAAIEDQAIVGAERDSVDAFIWQTLRSLAKKIGVDVSQTSMAWTVQVSRP